MGVCVCVRNSRSTQTKRPELNAQMKNMDNLNWIHEFDMPQYKKEMNATTIAAPAALPSHAIAMNN